MEKYVDLGCIAGDELLLDLYSVLAAKNLVHDLDPQGLVTLPASCSLWIGGLLGSCLLQGAPQLPQLTARIPFASQLEATYSVIGRRPT